MSLFNNITRNYPDYWASSQQTPLEKSTTAIVISIALGCLIVGGTLGAITLLIIKKCCCGSRSYSQEEDVETGETSLLLDRGR